MLYILSSTRCGYMKRGDFNFQLLKVYIMLISPSFCIVSTFLTNTTKLHCHQNNFRNLCMLNEFLKLFWWQCNFVVFVQTFKILLTKVVYFWWEIFWRVITLVTMGMKMENFWPSCVTNEQRTSMLVYWSSGTESMVLTNGWIILEAKSVKSKVSENLSIVSNAALKYTVYVISKTSSCI